MKKITLFFCAALAAVSFSSCNESKGDYPSYGYFVTVHPLNVAGGKDYYFSMDDNKTIYPGDKSRIGTYEAIEGQRAVLYFNTLPEKVEGYDYNAAVYQLQNIYTNAAHIVTDPEKLSKIADDKLSYGGCKLSENYLTALVAYTVYDNKQHTFDLIVDKTSNKAPMVEGYVDVELRHNKGGETTGTNSEYYISFSLNEIKPLFVGKKGLNLRINTQLNEVKYIQVEFPKSE